MHITRPTIVAHRGLHTRFPENSLAAMAAAWARGITWCECDVHLSSDRVPVVIHDETLDRTTTAKGDITDFQAAQLTKLHLLDPEGQCTEYRLPLLEEILGQMPFGCRLLVETKPELGEKIIPIARRVLETGGMLHSFNARDIEIARTALGSALSCAFLADKVGDAPPTARRIHLDHKQITAETACAYRAAGIRLGAWTVNDRPEKRRLAALGVDMIITDRPI
jgi:glycerophosphoryl diester phosphodiesterase